MRFKPDYSSRFRILKGGKISLVVSALLGSCVISFAAPSGGVVTSGSATISQSGKVTNINQATQKASINWQKFSVAVDETVNFNQPNVNSITLNRVVGNERSVIDGALNANGQVWILNSNGVLFGKNASINTAGLLATTKELSDQDFQVGNYTFKGDSTASVINLGEIDISNSGYATLLANTVSNEGTIKAVKGSVRLIGANEVAINFNGNSIVDLTVNKGVLDALVENKGAIYADGGEVYLTTNAVDELLKGVVNNEGIIEANSFESVTGYVELFAHGGTANISGSINALDGFVETSGDKVKISDDFRVKADKWLIDPTDFTIAASGGDITGATLSSNLESTDVEIQSVNGAKDGNGDIFVNDAISWDAETALILDAQNNIYINDTITSTNGGLVLFYGQATADGGTSDYYIKAKVNLKAGNTSFFTRKGSDESNFKGWTVITHDNLATAITTGGLGHNYVLGSDLDLSGITNWTPIGNSTTKFTGNFDGLGHVVDNLTIDRPDEDNIGLFGYTDGATIKNIGVTNVNIIGSSLVGGLIGNFSNSTISNSYSTGSVTAGLDSNFVGGLVGYSYNSTLSNSYSTANVTGSNFVGGLVGRNNQSIISNSYSTGSVTGGDAGSAGGLIGNNLNSTVSNSYSTANVTGGDEAYVGGLIGYSSNSTISNSYSTGSVIGGTDTRAGGLIGFSYNSTLSNSYSSGSVSLASGSTIGGLIGLNDTSTVDNSWYDNEENTATMDDSAYGKTKAQIVDALSPLEAWTAGGGASVEGYSTATPLTLPQLVAFYTSDGEILFAGGFGTETNPYTITNWTQLQNINHSNILTQSYYFSLLNDLSSSTSDYTDLASSTANSGAGWNPIGNISTRFIGTFDGLGNTVDSININDSDLVYAGLFGYTNGATIKNIGVTNVDILAKSYVGGLVGFNDNSSTVSNSYTSGSVEGGANSIVGGLVGYNNNGSTVSNSYSTVSATGGFNGYVGGLVGLNWNGSTISNSYSAGNVTKATNGFAGGLVGYNFSTVSHSYYDKDENTGTMDDSSYGKTTEELRTLAQANWSDTIWSFGGGADVEGYELALRPYLKNVTAEADKPDTFTLFEGGFGGSDDAYTITNWTQLQNINNSNILTKGYYFSLLNDLSSSTSDYTDLASSTANSGAGWKSIGYRTSYYDDSHRFVGNFDGLGHTIDGLYINRPTNNIANNNIGLFGYIYNSTLSNIGVTNANITGYSNVGALAGYIWDSTVQNSYSSGSVTSNYDYTGGLVGLTWNSTVADSYSSANVTAYTQVGGLVGGNSGDSIVRDSYATGTIKATATLGEGVAGGLVGDNSGDNDGSKIINSYATGDVSGNYSVGGLVGRMDYYSSVENSYASGDVSGTIGVGGLAGYAEYYILFENSYATGNVTGTGDYVGGLVGYNYRDNIVRNSYATGDVSGANYVGGLVGDNERNSLIENSYSIGSVSGTGDYTGGLVGANIDNSTVTNSYYDKTVVTGMADESSYGKTTDELKTLATFSGWDIETDSTLAKGNPFLAWQESDNGYTKTWVMGTKVASTGGGTTGGTTTGGGTTNNQQKEVEKIVTTIVNQESVTITLPKIQTTTTPNSAGQNVAVNFNAGGNQMLVSQPIEGQPTQRITLGEARQMQLENGVSGEEVRVPLSRSSMIELVDGGVNLPLGVEQEFYVAENN